MSHNDVLCPGFNKKFQLKLYVDNKLTQNSENEGKKVNFIKGTNRV